MSTAAFPTQLEPAQSESSRAVETIATAVEADTKPANSDVPPVRGTPAKLLVPLDRKTSFKTTTHKLVRRDSLERREAQLQGKEGSRQRRRWENDRLLNNPWVEPPLPSDYAPCPTHPIRRVPYYLAPLWDAAEFQRAIESRIKGRRNTLSKKNKKTSAAYGAGMSPFEEAAANIPKEVRSRLKHARSAKGLLQDLEEDVRGFVRAWSVHEMRLREQGLADAPLPYRLKATKTSTSAVLSDDENSEEDDEEIVFVGRNGTMHDMPPSPKSSRDSKGEGHDDGNETLLTEKLIFEGLEHDKGAAFGRWLTHCIGSYYGLRTWSITVPAKMSTGGYAERPNQNGKMRQAYVGVDSRVRGWMGRAVELGGDREIELPRPLWGMV